MYNLKLTNGADLVSIKPLEGNGVGNASTLLQVRDVAFKDISFGLPLASRPDAFVVSGDLSDQYRQGVTFTVSGGTGYDGQYTVNLTGFNLGDQVAAVVDGMTHIPVSVNLAQPDFDLIAIDATRTLLTVSGVSNGSTVFLPGRTVTYAGNSFAAVNGTSATISSAESSAVYAATSTDVGLSRFVIAGDKVKFFAPGAFINVTGTANSIGEGRYRVAAATLVSTNTQIQLDTTYKALPVGFPTTQPPNISLVTPVTVITIAAPAPVGTTASGSLINQAPTTATHGIAPTLTPTTPHNYIVTWHIAGQYQSQLPVGTLVQVKNARYNGVLYNNTFAITTISQIAPNGTYPAGLTEIGMNLNDPSAITPVITLSGSTSFVFPIPVSPFGYISYGTDDARSSLFLVGQGAPSYNASLTWGAAMQTNQIHTLENFASALPPVAPLKGQHWYDTATGATRVWTGSTPGIISVVTGTSGQWRFDSAASALPAAGQTLVVYNNPAMGLGASEYVVATAVQTTTPTTSSGFTTTITVTGTIPATADDIVSSNPLAPYGNGYSKALWRDIITTTIPAMGQVDMGGYKIINLGDATASTDALNMQTGDARYVNVTGDSMSGTLTMTGAANVAVSGTGGITVASGNVALSGGNVTMSGTGGVSVTGTGGITVASGNIVATSGSITAGSHITSTAGNIVATAGNVNVAGAAAQVNITGANGGVTLQAAANNTAILKNNGALVAPTLTFNTTAATVPTGNAVINLGNNKITNLSNPTGALDAVNKSYVDGLANGIMWLSPIQDPNMFNDSLTTPPVSPLVYTRTYYVPTGATGAWSSLIGRVVTWNGTTWVDILGRAIAVGDRFGVLINPDNDELGSLPAPGGGLTGHGGQIATVTNTSPLTWSFYTPVEPDAVSVTGAPQTGTGDQKNYSPHYGHAYTFRGTWGTGTYGINYQWIEFIGPQMLVDGAGLKYTGNVLNVGQGTGITVTADAVQLDLTYTDARFVKLDGTVAMTGLLTLSGAPTANLHAATKLYVDGRVLDNLADVVITTPANGNILSYNGTNWVNTAPAGAAASGADGSVQFAAAGVMASDATINFNSTTKTLALQNLTMSGGRIVSAVQSPAFSATPTFNAALSNIIYAGVLTANVTSVTISNPVNGQSLSIRFEQDGTGGWTVALPASVKADGAINLDPSRVTWLNLTYVGPAARWEGAWSQVPA